MIIEVARNNKLYHKYKSNIETILLHPEISTPIAADFTTWKNSVKS
jgi:hypothetical protein